MPVSTMTSKGQTTVPKEVRDARFIKHGEPDAVKAVAAARKMRGRI